MPVVGILGGIFDPIHNGHLRLALATRQQLSLDHVRLIPANIPPHRSMPVASSMHRRNMIARAIEGDAGLRMDLRETDSDASSYTINTLRSLRQEFPDVTFCLILGKDAFNKIDSWREWQALLNYAHIIVANRPGETKETVSPTLTAWIAEHQTNRAASMNEKLAGVIYFLDIPMLDISSSMIREKYAKHEVVNACLPASTLTYIKDNHLYLDTA